MKKILTAIIMLFSLTASAQTLDAGSFAIIPRVGSGLSIFHDMNPKAGSCLCSTIGADLKYQLGSRFGASAGLRYDFFISGRAQYETSVGSPSRYEFSYLGMPLLVHLDLYNLGFYAGVQPNLKLQGSLGDSSYQGNVEKANTFMVSVPIGVTWTFDFPVVVGLQYNHPITKATSGDGRPTVSGVMLTIGYQFD